MLAHSRVRAGRLHPIVRWCLLPILVLILSDCSQSTLPEYHTADLTLSKSLVLDYLIFTPADYQDDITWPLVLYLTGIDPGDDPYDFNSQGPPLALAQGLQRNFFLLAPQLPADLHWDAEALMELVQDIQGKYSIDPNQIYVTGFGDVGGWGCWNLATSYPGIFSKVAPISAPACTEICRTEKAAIRIYHGELDKRVPLADAENMRFELDHYCQADVDLTVYEGQGHEVWPQVYADPAFWLWFTGSTFGTAETDVNPMQQGQFGKKLTRMVTDNYLLYLPQGYKVPWKSWPLVIFLHGSGSAIEDIEKIRTTGPPKLFEEGMDSDFVLLAPQLHANLPWDVERVRALIDKIMTDYRIDPERIYITGLSRGGFGTWETAVNSPDLFAAVVPISARDVPAVERLASTNIWIFHGAADDGVPWQGSQYMYNRLKQAGANVQISLFEGVGHNAWDRAYGSPEFWQWLLAQRNTQ